MSTVQELYTAVDPQERMQRAVDRAIELTGAERGILFIQPNGHVEPRVARDDAGHDLPLDLPYSHTAVDIVRSTGKLLRRVMMSNEERLEFSHSVYFERIYSVLAARLDYEGRPLGVLYLDSTFTEETEFSENEEQVLHAIAGLVSAALENSRLVEEAAERTCLERQIRVAREVQERLLPRAVDAPEGYDMAGAGRACRYLSGDYYDVVPRNDGRVGLVIGDVSDHNIRSALHMTTTRALVRSRMRDDEDPDSVLSLLGAFLDDDMSDEEFMSIFLAVLDPRARTLVYASAGHNPPLLRRADGSMELLTKTGSILSALAVPAPGLAGPIELAPGDTLLLYTDGIYEAKGIDDERWGEERLRASLDRHAGAGRDAEGILEGILWDLDAYRNPGPLDDDITALVVRVE